ncbi:hypothetical protein V2H45_15150 [Tumidithrix elongata RA019]|uniref:Uncharacterized protein n=1 Tax=Tumidithrix elongata BACA0141 TaxID=2716417 RepID=A0AAW9PYZ2_9CYAN|nr:hypothetical protein [Tumidithrix elongata RA019]
MSQSEFGNLSASESESKLDVIASSSEQKIADRKILEQQVISSLETDRSPVTASLDSQHESQAPDLQSCHARNEQIHVLLYQAQEQLVLSQQVIECQEALTQTLQKRIEQLEHDLQIKSALIEQANSNCDELKERLKRQQHRNSQLKAAYEKRLDIEAESLKEEIPLMESWAVAKLAEEKINPIPAPHNDEALQNVVQIMPVAQEPIPAIAALNPNSPKLDAIKLNVNRSSSNLSTPIPSLPEFGLLDEPLPKRAIETAEASTKESIKPENPERESLDRASLNQHAYQPKLLLSQVSMPKFMQVLSDASVEPPDQDLEPTSATISNKRNTISSLAAVKLPQFPPLRRP